MESTAQSNGESARAERRALPGATPHTPELIHEIRSIHLQVLVIEKTLHAITITITITKSEMSDAHSRKPERRCCLPLNRCSG